MKLNAKKNNRVHVGLYGMAVIIWFIAVYISSSNPPLELMDKYDGIDKVAHLVVYGIFGLLVYLFLKHTTRSRQSHLYFIAVFIVLGAGIFDEFHQLSTPNRTFSFYDILADVTGAVLALISYRLIERKYSIDTSDLTLNQTHFLK